MQQKAIHVYLKEKVINRQDTQLFFASIFTISLTKLRPNLLSGIATIGIYCVFHVGTDEFKKPNIRILILYLLWSLYFALALKIRGDCYQTGIKMDISGLKIR